MNKQKLREVIRKEWNTASWMDINGFKFFMKDYRILTTSERISIYDKITSQLVTKIEIEEINSIAIGYDII